MAILFGTGVTKLDAALVALAAFLLIRLFRKRSNSSYAALPLPPGPRGKFLVGNAFEMPTQNEWETYEQWAEQYGDIMSVKVFGQSMILLNTYETAFDLMEKRSSLYSDRCEFPMLNDLMGFHWHFAFMRYGERWRRSRKAFHQKFHPEASKAHWDIQTRQTRNMLRRMQAEPDKWVQHIRHVAGAIIMEIIYGLKVQEKNDPYINTAEIAMDAMAQAGNAGAFLVDLLPFLKRVPEWFPGAGFQTKAKYWNKSITEMSQKPFNVVKAAISRGEANGSFTYELLEEARDVEEEKIIRDAGAAAYAGGSDTTVGVLHCFMLAMVLYPETAKKAQKELDTVVGPNRLPEFGDRESLPYIEAMCKEVLRWRPIVPLSVAHRLTEDDVYKGYLIPEGSLVVPNSWAMLHNEATYGPKPDEFIPDRFLDPNVRAPDPAFGFGRRICPGRYMADHSIFIAIASILHVFNISKAKNPDGTEKHVSGAFTSGFMIHPQPFECDIKPRSKAAEQLVANSAE